MRQLSILDARDIAGNQTILDGNNTQSVIYCYADAVIDGFTIQKGKGTNQGDGSGHSFRGGGIYIQNASPAIKNCTFKNNTAEQGGGIYIDAYNSTSSPQIINCLFANNSTQDLSSPANEGFLGGAILIAGDIANDSVNAQITNCTFISNSSNEYGGAVCVDNLNAANVSAIITCCTFYNNTASTSGPAVFTNANVTMNNCTLVNNDAATDGTTGSITKNNCIDNPAGTLTNSTQSVDGVTHTVFMIEGNPAALTEYVYSGTQIANITADQIGRTFHNPPSIGAVELIEDIAITTDSLAAGKINEAYTASITADGTEPLTWEISGLTKGLNANNSTTKTLTITGTPAEAGSFTVNISAANSAGSDDKSYSLVINDVDDIVVPVVLTAPKIITESLPNALIGENYSAVINASGSTPLTWQISGLPEGLTLEGSTITGTPNVFGEFEITINVKNDSGSDSKTFTLKIYSLHQRSDRNAPEITSRAPSDGYYKRFYSHKFTARGKAPITWQVSGDVPPGLEIDSELGTFSGVPAQTGEFIFTVTAANNSGLRSQNVTLKILDVPASMILFEKICSDPFVIKISELKGSGLNFDKIFRDNYSLFRIHRSKEAGAAFIEFIGSLGDYTASLQLSNMTSLVTAEFKGFNNQDFSFNYPDNQKANTSQIVNISDSDSDSKIPNNIIIGAVSEADANDIDSLVNTLDGSGLAKISRIEFISSDIKSLSGLEVFTGLKALCVNQCHNLESVTLTGCSTLESLIINNANITALDLTDCVNLTYLDVNECSKLAKLSGLNGNIKTLKAAYTSLAELDLTGKNKLAHLNLNESKLTKLDLTGCTGLEVLSLLNAKDLAELDLSQCPSLVDVYAGGTAIDKFASSSKNSLRKLDLSGCINLEGCDNLLELNINGTLFTELDWTGINTLTKLDAGSCTKLESLIINDCENLQELICSGCNLASLDLSHNNNLVIIDFRMNFVTNSFTVTGTAWHFLTCIIQT